MRTQITLILIIAILMLITMTLAVAYHHRTWATPQTITQCDLPPTATIPEPKTTALMALGLLALAVKNIKQR